MPSGFSPHGAPSPRRRFGQNFLVDPRVARRITDSVCADKGDVVIEIGPGRAALTGALIERFGRIAAVEIDRDLATDLRDRFAPEQLVLIEQDVLKLDLAMVARELSAQADARVVVVGNLPYNISKPFANRLASLRDTVPHAVLMFQREVAERLTATPGTKSYGPLTVLVDRTFAVEPLFDVSPQAFRPRPKVVSTVTRWTAKTASSFDSRLEQPLRRCLAAAFGRRRQTLFRNLRAVLPGGESEARRVLDDTGIDGGLRAEKLTPEEFVRLARYGFDR